MFFLNVIFGVTVFLLFIFALVVLSRVILLSKQIDAVQKVIQDADAKLLHLKEHFRSNPIASNNNVKKKK